MREAARKAMALDGADAQALEGVLAQTELECDKLVLKLEEIKKEGRKLLAGIQRIEHRAHTLIPLPPGTQSLRVIRNMARALLNPTKEENND